MNTSIISEGIEIVSDVATEAVDTALRAGDPLAAAAAPFAGRIASLALRNWRIVALLAGVVAVAKVVASRRAGADSPIAGPLDRPEMREQMA